MPVGMDNIEHVVVLMMENRSLDNLLGWLYADTNNKPPYNIPPQPQPQYEGLVRGKYCNKGPALHPGVVCAGEPTTAWPPYNNQMLVPDPDPGELFDQMTRQIFGTATPAPNATANMSGFLLDYSDQAGPVIAPQIMQSYSPQQAGVISQLARWFAVSDHWYASAPCQTWPNRGFVHTGSSDGHINNDGSELYDIDTIFNMMSNQGISWGVYHDTIYTPSLTWFQFSPKLFDHEFHFHHFSTFKSLCSAPANAPVDQKLPSYSFVEPRFLTEYWFSGIYPPEDYHPPHNVCISERFLAEVYSSVRQSPYRDKILLVITFDEHGGCYDHVAPPTGAKAPIPGSVSRYGNFHFDRFGVRVPTILVCSYVQQGTVFRAAGETPYDHTSILATLRNWKGMDGQGKTFLPSPRIGAAPLLNPVLTLSDTNKRTTWPSINADCSVGKFTEADMLNQPINDLQYSILIAVANERNNRQPIAAATAQLIQERLKTQQDAIDFMAPERLLANVEDLPPSMQP
jgi:phospholipase C